jgi:hypothetical protein
MIITDLVDPARPLLWIAPISRREICLGAFQRARSALSPAALEGPWPLTRRLSGGPALDLGPGMLHLLLALPSPSALLDADAARLVNRHVRPLLRALTRLGALSQYFGRDWVTVAHRPVAWVGFAHHAASAGCCFEAFVGLTRSFALAPGLDGYPRRAAPPFLGKPPASAEEASGKGIPIERAAALIGEAYEALGGGIARAPWTPEQVRPLAADERAPWTALVEAPIGFLGARAGGEIKEGGFGGDLLGSTDLVARLDAAVGGLPGGVLRAEIGALLGHALDQGGLIDGVRDPSTLIDLIEQATMHEVTGP